MRGSSSTTIPQVRVIVHTGNGRAFQTGVDVTEIATDGQGMQRYHDSVANFDLHFTSWHQEVWKPVITAVNGICCGGGFHWVADADIVIAASDAQFFDPHVSIGQVVAVEAIGLLRKMPVEAVMRMAFVGKYERMTVERAYELGMISQIVDPPEKLRDEAQALAEKIAQNSPAAMAATEEGAVGRARDGPHRRLPRRRAASRVDVGPPRSGRRPAAFAEKREPDWAELGSEVTESLGARRAVTDRSTADEPTGGRPLDGVRVLAVEQMIAAPWATQLLRASRRRRDQGRASRQRRIGSRVAAVRSPTPTAGSVGATFLRNNLDKRSVGIDLGRGADLVAALAERATCSSRTSRPARSTSVGLGYDDARRAQPPPHLRVDHRLRHHRPTRPTESWPAYASIAEAMSGIYEWGRQPGLPPVDQPGRRPRRHRHRHVRGDGHPRRAAAPRTHRRGPARRRLDVRRHGRRSPTSSPRCGRSALARRLPARILDAFAASDGYFVLAGQPRAPVREARRTSSAIRSGSTTLGSRPVRAGSTTSRRASARPSKHGPATERSSTCARRSPTAASRPGRATRAEDVLADPHVAQRDMLARFTRRRRRALRRAGQPDQALRLRRRRPIGAGPGSASTPTTSSTICSVSTTSASPPFAPTASSADRTFPTRGDHHHGRPLRLHDAGDDARRTASSASRSTGPTGSTRSTP